MTKSQDETNKDLQRQLQRSLTTLKTALCVFKETGEKSKHCIDKVLNLTEQYQCCEKVNTAGLPKNVDFTDVQERLLYKITLEINKELGVIQSQVLRLEDCSAKLGKHYDHCMSHYRKTCNLEDTLTLIQRSATKPAIADMLEWMDVSARLYRERYLCKQHLAQTFSPQSEECDLFLKHWTAGDSHVINKIEEYLAMSAVFLEEPIT